MFALGVPEVLVGSVYFERHMLGFEPMKSQTYKYSRQRDRHTIEVRKKHTGRSQLGHCWLLSVHVFWFFFFFLCLWYLFAKTILAWKTHDDFCSKRQTVHILRATKKGKLNPSYLEPRRKDYCIHPLLNQRVLWEAKDYKFAKLLLYVILRGKVCTNCCQFGQDWIN